VFFALAARTYVSDLKEAESARAQLDKGLAPQPA